MVDARLVSDSGWVAASVVLEVFPGFESTLKSDRLVRSLLEQHASLPSVADGASATGELFPLLAGVDPVGDRVFQADELPVVAKEAAGFASLLSGKWRGQYSVLSDLAQWANDDPGVRLELLGD